MSKDWTLYEREPIKLGKNTVMLIQIFTKADRLEDLCWHDGCLTGGFEKRGHEFRKAAKQLFLQLEGRCCPAFIMALRDECETDLRQWERDSKHIRANLKRQKKSPTRRAGR